MLDNLWWKDLGTTCLGWIESDPSVLDFTSNNKIAGHTRKKGPFGITYILSFQDFLG